MNLKESFIELIDGDPVSALGEISPFNGAGKVCKALAFTVLTHLAMGTMGAIDIPWGTSSAFGTPHYRFLNEKRKKLMVSRGELLISSLTQHRECDK